MKFRQVLFGIGLLFVLLTACSIPVSASSVSGDISGTPFTWMIDTSSAYMGIDFVAGRGGSTELTSANINGISWPSGFGPQDVRNLSLSSNISRIVSGAFGTFTGLTSLTFLNATAVVDNGAFPSGKVYAVVTDTGIQSITTHWGVPGDEVDFVYSIVHNESVSRLAILRVDSRQSISICSDYTDPSYPLCWFQMPNNQVGLSIVTSDSSGTRKGLTSVSYMTCRVNVTSDSNINFTVSALKYNSSGIKERISVPVINGTASEIFYGDEGRVEVTVTEYPAGNILSASTYGVGTYTWAGCTFSIDSYNSDADNGLITVNLVSSPPPAPSPTSRPGGPTDNMQTKILPLEVPDFESSQAAIEGIVTSTGDNRATVTDVTATYPGVSDAADAYININAALTGLSTSSLSIFTSGLSSEAAAKVQDIISKAAAKGILTTSTSNMPLIIDLSDSASSSDATPIKFYKTFDIVPDAGEDSLRQVMFSVPLADISASGITTSDVVMYHGYPDDSIWVPLETALTSTSDTNAHYTAETNGASPFAILFYRKDVLIEPGNTIHDIFVYPRTTVVTVIIVISVIIATIAVGAAVIHLVLRYMKKHPYYPLYQKARKAGRKRRKRKQE